MRIDDGMRATYIIAVAEKLERSCTGAEILERALQKPIKLSLANNSYARSIIMKCSVTLVRWQN